jgi:hypothetical protein
MMGLALTPASVKVCKNLPGGTLLLRSRRTSKPKTAAAAPILTLPYFPPSGAKEKRHLGAVEAMPRNTADAPYSTIARMPKIGVPPIMTRFSKTPPTIAPRMLMPRGHELAGPADNPYRLMDDNGKLWNLRSKNVSFAPHVGHLVTVSGTIPHKSNNDNDRTSDTSPQNDLMVTKLDMVRDTCTP